MPAARAPEGRLFAGFGLKLLLRFGLVGVTATALYALLATAFVKIGLAPVRASVAAYSVAALFSYFAHKSVTFVSSGPHRSEGLRFILLTASGFALAYAVPTLLTVKLGLPLIISVLATCFVIPVVNLFLLDRWVFAKRKSN
jgi:putative flippase GtrA